MVFSLNYRNIASYVRSDDELGHRKVECYVEETPPW